MSICIYVFLYNVTLPLNFKAIKQPLHKIFTLGHNPVGVVSNLHITQGCKARATLGQRPQKISNRNAVAAIPFSSIADFATTALRLNPFPHRDPR
jgi:hypothetical protein